MKKLLLNVILAFACTQLPLMADDKVPSGYEPLSNLQGVIKESAGKKLIVLMAHGRNDKCPNCAAAVKNGERAIGTGVMKVFVRAEEFNAMDKSQLPASLQARGAKKFIGGASVYFLVFDPQMEKIIAESSRMELQNNAKLTAEFKKVVQEAKQKIK